MGKSLLEGVVLYAGDMERMKAFYRDVVGLQLLFEEEHVVHFDAGSVRLAIHKRTDREAKPPGDGFLVFAVEDVDLTCNELRKRGAAVDGPKDRPYGRVAYVDDPEGHLIGFWRVPQAGAAGHGLPSPTISRYWRVADRLLR